MSDESGSLALLLWREIAWYERFVRMRLFEQDDCRISDDLDEKDEGRERKEEKERRYPYARNFWGGNIYCFSFFCTICEGRMAR